MSLLDICLIAAFLGMAAVALLCSLAYARINARQWKRINDLTEECDEWRSAYHTLLSHGPVATPLPIDVTAYLPYAAATPEWLAVVRDGTANFQQTVHDARKEWC